MISFWRHNKFSMLLTLYYGLTTWIQSRRLTTIQSGIKNIFDFNCSIVMILEDRMTQGESKCKCIFAIFSTLLMIYKSKHRYIHIKYLQVNSNFLYKLWIKKLIDKIFSTQYIPIFILFLLINYERISLCYNF